MLKMIDTKPHKIVFLGPGCSVATTPVAEAAPYWHAVQVTLLNTSGLYDQFVCWLVWHFLT